MKVTDAKRVVQNMVFASKETMFSMDEALSIIPELVDASRQGNAKELSLYRILKLREGKSHNSFGVSSTSKLIHPCINIANSMPSLVFDNSESFSLTPKLFRFEVPNNKIIIDYSVALPLIKEKLKNVLNHKVYNKYGDPLSISEAITAYEREDEHEVVADLSGLDYRHASIIDKLDVVLNTKSFEKNKKIGCYLEDFARTISTLSPILDDDQITEMEHWFKNALHN